MDTGRIKLLNTPSVLIICGAILSIFGNFTFGVILTSLGILGAIVGFAINIQRETQERADREKLYDNIKKTLGVSIPTLINSDTNVVH